MMPSIEISKDEALVLLELLAGYGEHDDGRELAVRHVAERNALWGLSGALERTLAEPFRADWPERLREARERLEAKGGPW